MKARGKLRIKTRIMIWMGAFCLILLVLLWLLLSVFLSDLYSAVTRRTAERTADGITEIIREGIDTADEAEYRAQLGDMCLMLCRIDEGQLTLLVSYEAKPDCAVHSLTPFGRYLLYEQAVKNGGRYTERIAAVPPDKGLRVPDSILIVATAEGPNGDSYVFYLSCELEPVSAAVKTVNLVLLVIVAAMFLAAVVLAPGISGRISRPITRLTENAKQLASGDYTVTFDTDGDREVAELGGALNHAVQQLSQVDKLRTELVANISHDLRTPLTLISGTAELMRDVPGEDNRENAQLIIDETGRLSMIVNDVLDLSRIQAEQLRMERFSLTDCVAETAESYSRLGGVRVVFEPSENAVIEGDRVKVSRLFSNLVANAVEHTGADRLVHITQTVTAGHVLIAVKDSGPGISADELPHLFDKYYKGKGENLKRRGTGLGLAIVKAVAQAHRARFGVNSGADGSEFWVEFRLDGESGAQ